MLVFIGVFIFSLTGNVLSIPEESHERCGTKVPKCPKHEHYVQDDDRCIRTCGNRLIPGSDNTCEPYTGCVCNKGYIKKYDNGTGICIPKRQCPPIPKECGINEEPTSCRTICPPQTCESIYTTYHCEETDCEPGCDCIDNYLRNSDGVCIPSEDCFKRDVECGPNEVATDCKITCPPQTCESLYVDYDCADLGCTPGCNCIDGYLRNSLGECVPIEECVNDPAGCNGDRNASHVPCGDICPATCAEPYNDKPCREICMLNGCKCKPGYIMNEEGGVCIDPNDCPGGSPKCGANETYVDCSFNCPTNYCPDSDARYQVACSPPYPCYGGCNCKAGYLRLSYEDRICVLASDCIPVTCTRQNEVWDPTPSNCYLERCEDRGSICDFYPYPDPPRCVCVDGFYRNESDVCVPASECPDQECNGDPNAMPHPCPSSCPATCENINYDRSDLLCIDACDPSGCVCKPGYILTQRGGVCVLPENCPAS